MRTDKELIAEYAKLIAEQTSGIRGSYPEQIDYDIAREIHACIETKIRE